MLRTVQQSQEMAPTYLNYAVSKGSSAEPSDSSKTTTIWIF